MAELRALWRRLDTAGVDWISVWDHLYEAPPLGGTVDHFDALSTLGALAADTSRARIGCLVFCVLYRNPGMLAKDATTLDHISGGRFELGLGAGWHEQEAEAFGYDFPSVGRRLDQLEEAFPLIRSLLTQERTTHAGESFRTVDASCLPRPCRSGSRSGSAARGRSARCGSRPSTPAGGTPPTSRRTATASSTPWPTGGAGPWAGTRPRCAGA